MRMSAADSYGYYMQDLCPSCAACQTDLSNVLRVGGGGGGYQVKES